jgi:hypothetical protein
LRRGIASAARRGWIQRKAPVNTGRDRRWQIAIAASAVLSLGVVLSLVVPQGETTIPGKRLFANAGEQHIASTRTVRLGSVRGTGGVPDVSILLTDAPSEMVIEPDVVVLTCPDGAIELECVGGSAPLTPQYAEYEIDLVKRHGATLAWRSSRQIPVGRTQLSFTLHEPGSFDAGDYDLLVRGHSPDHEEVVARFWFRVSAQ